MNRKKAQLTTIISSSSAPKDEIKQAFDKIKETVDSSKLNSKQTYIVEGPNFKIDKARFVFYKANVEMTHH